MEQYIDTFDTLLECELQPVFIHLDNLKRKKGKWFKGENTFNV